MKKIEFEELKRLQLEILKEVDKYCQSNGLKYSLAYGTLIGAIRHKGYIPWDDDIDIIMPRADYELFVRNFNGSNKQFCVISPYTNNKYYAPYANVINVDTLLYESVNHGVEIGVKIDIFPIDNVPDTLQGQRELFKRVNKLTRLINIISSEGKGETNGFKSRLFFIFKSFFMKKISYSRELNDLAKRSNEENVNSNYVNNIVWCAAKEKGCFKKTDMDEYLDVEFEGCLFKSIKGYDDFLTAHYGNYMVLPPKEKQVPHHTFDAYWR